MSSRLQVVEIPIGNDGLNGSSNMSQIPITALISANNVTFESGTIQKEGGASKYNSTAISGTPSILGGWDWDHDGGTQRMIVLTSAGALLKDSGAGTFGTTLKSGLTVTDVIPIFVEGGKEAAANNRKLFTFTGSNQVQVLSADGATTSNLTTPPTDWSTVYPTFGAVHEGRLWGGGNTNDPHRLYYSTPDDHEDFTGTTAGTVAVFPGEGEKLVGAISFKGVLICFKYPTGIYFVDTTSPLITNWSVVKLSNAIGCIGLRGFTIVENDIMFIDRNEDIRLLSSTDQFGDVGTRSLSDTQNMQDFIRRNLNFAQHAKWQMTYYSRKREVHIASTGSGSTTNNYRIVVDLNKPGIARFRTSDRDTPISIWLRKNNAQSELVIGDDAGFVWKLDQSSRSKDSLGYNAEFKTPYTDLSYVDEKLGVMRKNSSFLEMVIEPSGNWDMNVDVYYDGEYSQTVTFNMGSDAAALGSFVLGTDKLGGDAIANKKRRITGSFRRIALTGKNSSAGQDFSIARMFLHYKPGGERL